MNEVIRDNTSLNDGQRAQPITSKGSVSPDYASFNGLTEQKESWVVSLARCVERRGTSDLGLLGAIGALTYIGVEVVRAGQNLTPIALGGALVVCLLLFSLALVALRTGSKTHGQNSEGRADKPTQP